MRGSNFGNYAASGSGGVATYPGTILGTSGLVSYWRLDETSGTVAADAFGSNPGTYNSPYTQGVTSAATKLGTAVSFGGSGSISVPNASSLQITSALSVECWAYSSSPTTTQEVVCKPYTSSASNPYFDYCISNGRSGHFAFFVGIGGTFYEVNCNTSIASNTWYHIVGVYNGTDLRIYINGALDCTPVAASGSLNANSQPLWIGSAGWGSSEAYVGAVDEVAVYNTALSAPTVLAHYNAAF